MIAKESDSGNYADSVKAEASSARHLAESARALSEALNDFATEAEDQAEAVGTHPEDAPPAPKTRHRAASYDRGVQIAAARLRLVTDSQLGLETPDWVKELAAG